MSMAVAIVATIPGTGAPVAAEPLEPPPEWVKTSDDSVMPLDTYRAISESDGPFQPILAGAGFNAYDIHNMGAYTIRLVASPEGNIEEYRGLLQQTANELAAAGGAAIQVAAGTVAGPGDPWFLDPAHGEIWVMIATDSPCGFLVGGALGCGGPHDERFVNGEYRWSSGVVWLQPGMQASCRQGAASHEVGHALGLSHFDAKYENKYQLMRSTTNCVSPINFQSGDLNGHRWLVEGAPPRPSYDNVAAADLVCAVRDSTVTVDTRYATTEAIEPSHAGHLARRSVWYRYTAQVAGTTKVETVNDDFAPALAVYTGSMYGSATPLVSDDPGGGVTKVTFTAVVGVTYWIALSDLSSFGGVTDVVFDLPSNSVPSPPSGAPTRFLDTRRPGGQTFDCTDQQTGRLAAGSTYELTVTNRAYVANGATSVVLNVTVVSPAASGYVTVFPCGSAQPNASNLNFTAGEVIPNLVIAKVGPGGKVCFFVSSATDLLVDVSGFNTSDLTTINPARLLDTRAGGQTTDSSHAGVGAIPAGGTYELPVLNRGGVELNAGTVVLNVTAVGALTGGYLTVYPCGSPQPNASNLNFAAGDTIPNAVIARVGTGGKVCFFSETTVHLLVDANGFFLTTPPKWNPLNAPARVLDTRNPGGQTADHQHEAVGRFAANTTYALPIVGRVDITAAKTVVLNVTAVFPTGPGYITVFPCGQGQPNASNLNFSGGEVIPNSVIVDVGTGGGNAGKVCFFTSAAVDLIVDVSGYFTA